MKPLPKGSKNEADEAGRWSARGLTDLARRARRSYHKIAAANQVSMSPLGRIGLVPASPGGHQLRQTGSQCSASDLLP